MKRLALAVAALLATFVPAVSAHAATITLSATLQVSTHHVPAAGGTIKFTADVSGGETCELFSAPRISAVDKTFACSTGTVVRKSRIPSIAGSRSMEFALATTGTSGVVVSNPVTVTQSTFKVSTTSPPEQHPLNISGSGPATTASFSIPANTGLWFVDWSYTCPAGFGDFSYDVYTGNEVDFNDPGPLDLNLSGSSEDSFTDSGTFELQVLTACNWSIEVSYFPPTPTPPSVKKPPVVTASLASSVPVVAQAGGPATLTAKTKHATWCTFISSPPIPGFDGRVRCSSGTTARQVQLPTTATPQSYEAEVVATGTGTLAEADASLVQRDPQTLVSMSGSSDETSPQFTIPPTDSQWMLNWSYSCPTEFGFQEVGYVDVDVTNSISDDFVSPVSSSDSGTQTFTDTGTFSLDIISSCSWTVAVVG